MGNRSLIKQHRTQKTIRNFLPIFIHATKPYQTASNAYWRTPQDVKKMYVNASIIANNRVVFNIKGNAYRLIVKFNYERQWAFIRFVGTHSEYDAIDATTI